ncbi:MAG: class I SAM-dependent methyltransferase, partial [Planctomycetota bacterium]|nr:class I SAM-dependent methyltransferase [Planctomycetota bacterium]
INPSFVQHLQRRIESQECFAPMRERIKIEQGDIRLRNAGPHYDAILSGLPFNNFSPDEVIGFLEHFRALLKPGGTLSYFEYVAIRKLQAPFVSKERRVRLRAISKVVEEFAREHQLKSDIVPINFPPARVRHLCFRA